MSELPYFPYYMGDMIADTAHLDTEEFGAYIRLLQHYYKKRQGPPDNAKILKNITQLSAHKFRNIYPVLMEFFEVRDGRLWQKRVEKELKLAAEKHEKRVAAGRAGGLAKAQQSSSNALAEGVANGKQSDSDSEFNTPPPPTSGGHDDREPDKPAKQGRRLNGTNPRARNENPRAIAEREAEEKRKLAEIERKIEQEVEYAWAEIHAVPYHEWKQQQEERSRSPDDEVVL